MVKDLNIRFSRVLWCLISAAIGEHLVSMTFFFFSELQKKIADFKCNIARQVNTAS